MIQRRSQVVNEVRNHTVEAKGCGVGPANQPRSCCRANWLVCGEAGIFGSSCQDRESLAELSQEDFGTVELPQRGEQLVWWSARRHLRLLSATADHSVSQASVRARLGFDEDIARHHVAAGTPSTNYPGSETISSARPHIPAAVRLSGPRGDAQAKKRASSAWVACCCRVGVT